MPPFWGEPPGIARLKRRTSSGVSHAELQAYRPQPALPAGRSLAATAARRFEFALDRLIDHELDLSAFDSHYRNDTCGASAYPPGVFLKIVLFAYSQGIVGSRGIERACRDNIVFIALSGDNAPHFTTLAGFVATRSQAIADLFAQVVYLCDHQGLIGRQIRHRRRQAAGQHQQANTGSE